MNRIYILIVLAFLSISLKAQTPCQLTLDSIYIDQTYSNCNHLYFKYNVSGGTASSYHWTYGDGNSCGCYKPKNFYTKNGTYQVCGRIQDANGCKDSLCITVNVNCTNPCDLSEIGIYSYDTVSYNCNDYEFVSFISPNAKRIVWDFGDGDSSNNKYALHTYSKNGKYTVKLIVQDSIACGDTAILDIDINCAQQKPCDFKINRIDSSSQANCKVKNFNLFANHPVKSVKWDFGDQNSMIAGSMIQHTYLDTGKFVVCAIANDSLNCLDTMCLSIKIQCPQLNLKLINAEGKYKIYPIPFQDLLNIESNVNGSLMVYNLQMQLIYQANLVLGENQFNLNTLKKGIYYLTVNTEEGLSNYKLIKE